MSQVNSFDGGAALPGDTLSRSDVKSLTLRHFPDAITPVDSVYNPLTEKTQGVLPCVFKRNGQVEQVYDPLSRSVEVELGGGGGDSELVVVQCPSMRSAGYIEEEKFNIINSAVSSGKTVVIETQEGSTIVSYLLQSVGPTGLAFATVNASYTETVRVSNTPTPGSTLYPVEFIPSSSTIFKTVADMQAASLNVGDVVETAGFHSVNDGGGAKYQIQATGTANDMDLILVAGGKIAKLLALDSAYPDQLGYRRATSSNDVVPYINRLFTIGIIHIKLHCDRYYMHQRLNMIAGSSIEGIAKRSDDFGGLSRLIFMNNASPVAIIANKYDCRLYNFDLYCSSAHTGDTIGVLTNGTIDGGAAQQGCVIERVKFNGFKTGCSFEGDVNWNLSISGCIFENEDYGVVLNSNKLNVQFDTCYWNHCNEVDVIVRKYTSAMAFRSCNFGIYKKAVNLKYNRYDWRNFGEIEFSSCNFEVDVNNLQSVIGCFLDAEDYCQVSLIFNSCTFNIDKAGSSTSGFAFGNKSRVVFEACHCQEEQYVNYQGDLFDSQRPPELSVGSLHVGFGCYGFAKPSYDTLHASCVKFDEDFLVANLKVNPNNLYDKVHTNFTYAGIRKVGDVWEFFTESGVYSGSIVIDIPLYYRDKALTVSMSPGSHNRWIIAATDIHPDIDRSVTPIILSETYDSGDGRDFASINMGGKRYLTIYYYNLPSDASDEKFYIRDDMMLSLGSYHYPYVPHYINYSDIKIPEAFINAPSKVEILAGSGGGGVTDCNLVIPEQSGMTIFAQVNSFDETLNLPNGFSGFGLLQSSLMINGTRLLQTLFSQSSIYCRRRILVSGSWTWQAWYKAEMSLA